MPDEIVKPNPYPTEPVKEALALAIANLRRELTQRLDDNDKAVKLARDEVKAAAADLAKSQADALEAALKATTDSNAKLEQSFEKTNTATNEKIDRLTERINIWTGRDSNVVESKHESSSDRGQLITMISVVIAAASLLYAVLSHH